MQALRAYRLPHHAIAVLEALKLPVLQAVSVALPLSGCYAKGMMAQSAASLVESGLGCVTPLAARSWHFQHSNQLCAAKGLLRKPGSCVPALQLRACRGPTVWQHVSIVLVSGLVL